MEEEYPYFIGALREVPAEKAREAALHQFIEQLGHEAVNIPIISDAKGTMHYSRFRLRDFLMELKAIKGK